MKNDIPAEAKALFEAVKRSQVTLQELVEALYEFISGDNKLKDSVCPRCGGSLKRMYDFYTSKLIYVICMSCEYDKQIK